MYHVKLCVTIRIIYSNNLRRQGTLGTLPKEVAFFINENPNVRGAHSHHPNHTAEFQAFIHMSNPLMSVEPARY